MLSKLFRPRVKTSPAAQASVPHGIRIYAVGDIHGKLDLLDRLLADIVVDDASRPAAETHLVFLGDLIDRGPQSAEVIDRLLALSTSRPNTHFLLGNHEEVFLKVLRGDTKALPFFTRIGGRETILSYGVSEQQYQEADYSELLELVQARVPAEHISFLERFEDLLIWGDYAFVHAGIRPGEPLAKQRQSDLRWIREEFLSYSQPLEKIIVHGHTITDDVEELPNRIGIDTGAYLSGKLTAMCFEGPTRWQLQT